MPRPRKQPVQTAPAADQFVPAPTTTAKLAPFVNIATRISTRAHRALKSYCGARGITIGEGLTEILLAYLGEELSLIDAHETKRLAGEEK